eukprot:6206487-Pleurochrysis_carterae.AAC.2
MPLSTQHAARVSRQLSLSYTSRRACKQYVSSIASPGYVLKPCSIWSSGADPAARRCCTLGAGAAAARDRSEI